MSEKKLPVLNLRYWPVNLAAWENKDERGNSYFSAKLTESFKNRDGNYEDSQYINSRNWDKAAALLREACSRLVIEDRQVGKGKAQEEEGEGEVPF